MVTRPRFGSYRLLKRLALGGTAEVYLATDTRSPSVGLLALKRLLPHGAEDPQCVAMFRHEAAMMAQLQHPNIIAFHEAGQAGGLDFIASHFIQGATLATLLKRLRVTQSTFSVREVGSIALQVVQGLHYLHTDTTARGHALAGVHRDVTPSNLFVGMDGNVSILDFGTGTYRGQAHRHDLTLRHGKPAYMSPEQTRGDAVGPPSDVFSLGRVLDECWRGGRLAQEEDLSRLHAPQGVSPTSTSLDLPFEAIVQGMLAPRPGDRPDASMLRVELSLLFEPCDPGTATNRTRSLSRVAHRAFERVYPDFVPLSAAGSVEAVWSNLTAPQPVPPAPVATPPSPKPGPSPARTEGTSEKKAGD